MQDVTSLASNYAAYTPLRILMRAQAAYAAARGSEREQLDAYFAVLARHATRIRQRERDARHSVRARCRSVRRPGTARARRSRVVRAAGNRGGPSSDPDGEPSDLHRLARWISVHRCEVAS